MSDQFLVLILGGAVLASALHAQIDPTDLRDDTDRRSSRLPMRFEIEPAVSEDLGVIELVSRRPRPPWLAFSTAQRLLYVDNLFLSETDRVKSGGWNGWFELEVTPYATFLWKPSLSIEHEMYRFERNSEADFDSQIIRAQSSLGLLPDRSVRWELSYAYWRLTDPGEDAFLEMGELRHRLIWTRPLWRQPEVWLIASWDFEVRHASPSAEDRFSHELSFATVWLATPETELEIFVEPEVRYYRHDPVAGRARQDFHVDAGLRGSWWPWERLSLSSEIRWLKNISDVEGRDYRAWEPSVSIYGTLWF